jgi:hypothetical protein
MKLTRTLIALAATGGTAAALFGGTAVATAFTSQSPTQYAEGQGATTGITVTGGTFDATNLVPGATATQESITVTNNGSVPATGTLTVGAFTVKTAGSNGNNPDPADLAFVINVGGGSNEVDGTAATLQNSTPLAFGPLPAGASVTVPVDVSLVSGTGNDWNGADAYLPYSITLTAGS